MLYTSTRGRAEDKTFTEILLEGLAPDGGLYVPRYYPQFLDKDLRILREQDYRAVAHYVLHLLGLDMGPVEVMKLLGRVYTKEKFGSPEITPVEWLEPGLGLLRLSNGPTFAFKDIALQPLAALMEHVLGERNEELNILGATSGDTGSAAEYAFIGSKRARVFMLSPYGRMSPFQRAQMYTLNEPNIFNLVVDGTFDDCQDVVKAVNEDAAFKAKYRIGAVNSINWARIALQVVYYVYAYLRATEQEGERVMFSIPSGNFGNALAAHVARQMGLPIRSIIVAANENDVLYEFFATGIYRVRKGTDVVPTSSPSMDIASASNFERFIFDSVDRDAEIVSDLWGDLKKKGSFDGRFITPRFGYTWESGRASEADVDFTIRDVYKKYGVIIDPHTAVGMYVGLQCRKQNIPLIVVETAQPAKFADTIRRAIGIEPPVPKGFEKLLQLPEHTTRIPPDPEVVKRFIAANVL